MVLFSLVITKWLKYEKNIYFYAKMWEKVEQNIKNIFERFQGWHLIAILYSVTSTNYIPFTLLITSEHKQGTNWKSAN